MLSHLTSRFHHLSPGHIMPIMFADVPDVPDHLWSWQNNQMVVFYSRCLELNAAYDQYDRSTAVARIDHDIDTSEVFGLLSVRFPQPSVQPPVRSTWLNLRCWRPHTRFRRFATTIKTTPQTIVRSLHAFGTITRPLHATYDRQYATVTKWTTNVTTMDQIRMIASIGMDWWGIVMSSLLLLITMNGAISPIT